ncbi:30S ribosome-binding factor RbfA [Magnetospirillum sulfuroxidans]|uniref:Ribosome-binding factor A n=1 Tax=Magnetospirillum sulfuroxidans TaxID=611300 RepID=A0ABS5IG02_9PROT|nr:30S ribosome-binding factor RbfA [Magnetospirillum sulfuroxidans]MBR9973364.1 30S ribosome-binding factor RbfA [Magnetospirillum sulfuroxidans]
MPRGQKPPSQRQLRVGEELRHIIASIIERGEIRDPDLAGRAITVTEVRISPDLKNATVFVMPLGGGEVTTVVKGLKRARAFLRHEVARQVDLRIAPELFFEADTSFDEASHIDALLRSPEVRRDLGANENTVRAVDDFDGEDDGE